MPVLRSKSAGALCCVLLMLLMAGCLGGPSECPQGSVTAEPATIPDGLSETDLFVDVHFPSSFDGFVAMTELSTVSGTIGDPSARATTYACAHDISGPVEICVETVYVDADAGGGTLSEVPGIQAVYEYIRPSHIRLPDPLECSHKSCTVVVCPEVKNVCPEVSSLTIEPSALADGETATVEVVAEDPDDNPEALVTTLTARRGTIADPHARETSYTCPPDGRGVIEICVVASDGDSSCDVERCTSVQCPGTPDENTCPIIESLTATPMTIPPGETTATILVDATDPDDSPVPLRTELSAETGVFADRFASETTFTCGDSGPVQICAKANDGDPNCNERSCTTVQCPSDIPANLCPQLFVINPVPRVIPDGQTSTSVETRGQDTDGLPFPLVLTLSALWGSFEMADNIQQPNNVVAQNATYLCDRPGEVEICVDATDGACTKTLCDNVVCPDTVPTPP